MGSAFAPPELPSNISVVVAPLVTRGLIYEISYDCLTITPKLRSTYDVRIIYQTSYEGRANSYVRFTCKIVR